MTEAQDKDLSALGDTFKQVLTHVKSGFAVWDDFVTRGLRFQKQLENTIASFNSFLEGFNRVAELSLHAKGGSKEMGAGLSNLVMWHRGQEVKMREMNQALVNKLLAPLQVKVDEWKKTTAHLDREHEKDVQRSIKDIRESFKTTMKAKSKLKKDKPPEKATALRSQYEQQQQECDRRLHEAEEKERRYLSRILLEERGWFCGFTNAFSRVLDIKVSMLSDLEPLKGILTDLSSAISTTGILPDHAKEFVESWEIPTYSSRKRVGSSTLTHTVTPAPSMLSVSSNSSGDSVGPTPVAPPLPPDLSITQRRPSTGSAGSSQLPTSGPAAPSVPTPPPIPPDFGATQQQPVVSNGQYSPSVPAPPPNYVAPPAPPMPGMVQRQSSTGPPPNPVPPPPTTGVSQRKISTGLPPVPPPIPANYGASQQQWSDANSMQAPPNPPNTWANQQWSMANHMPSTQHSPTVYAIPGPINPVQQYSSLPPPPPGNFPPTSMDGYATHTRVSPQPSYPNTAGHMHGSSQPSYPSQVYASSQHSYPNAASQVYASSQHSYPNAGSQVHGSSQHSYPNAGSQVHGSSQHSYPNATSQVHGSSQHSFPNAASQLYASSQHSYPNATTTASQVHSSSQPSYPIAAPTASPPHGHGYEYSAPSHNGYAAHVHQTSAEQYEPSSLSVHPMSGSPSQSSLTSTQYEESSLSRSPATSRSQLSSHPEGDLPVADNFQQALVNRLRLRAQSIEGGAVHSTSTDNHPVHQRIATNGTRPGPPVVAKKTKPPPRVAHKPMRQPSMNEYHCAAANGGPPQNYAHPHHVLHPDSLSSRPDSSSDDDEELSAFAKALKQKKLRKAAQANDRSNVRMGYR